MLDYVLTIIYIITFLVVMYMLLKIYKFIVQEHYVFERKRRRLEEKNKKMNSYAKLLQRRENRFQI